MYLQHAPSLAIPVHHIYNTPPHLAILVHDIYNTPPHLPIPVHHIYKTLIWRSGSSYTLNTPLFLAEPSCIYNTRPLIGDWIHHIS